MAEIGDRLQQVPGVHDVQVNPASGSIVVQHDPDSTVLPALEQALGEPVAFALDLIPPRERDRAAATATKLARVVNAVLRRFDAALLRASGGWFDLRMFLPLALIGLAALEVALREGSLSSTSPVVLLLLAIDAYGRFHRPLAPTAV
jgi:copper chaperone CopZ